jgi:predicted DNA binding CopG/RHH family protein
MSKSSKSRDVLAKRLMNELLARLDDPKPLVVPDVALESVAIDDDWSLFKELHPKSYKSATEPDSAGRLKSTVSGTKPITIRIPNRVLQEFHRQADKTGVPYQTLMNRVLAHAAADMGSSATYKE